jgi:hypothetical protein
MTRRAFEVIDIVEILQHWHAGRPKAVVARSVGVDRSTVDKYVAAAIAAGLSPGGASLSRAEWSELVRGWFPELVEARSRSLTFSSIHEHHGRIEEMLKTNTATTVHQRLRDEHGLSVSISSFRRYLWLEFPDEVTADKVTVPRPAIEAGDEAQIDYGLLGMWNDPLTGRRRRVWAFVMVLASSRHMFVRPVLRMDKQSFVACHVAAFEFFGGCAKRLVPDNPKTAVTHPDLYDPKINRAYAEMASHYDCLVDPARAGKPKDKPRVERPMPYVRDSFWRGREWESEQAMQLGAIKWCLEVAGLRHHRSLEGASPLSVFAAVEKEALLPLPLQVFELAAWSRPKVGTDCHAKVGKVLYSVPWRYIGRHLEARESDRTVEFFADDVLVKTWPRADKGKRTDFSDFPPEKIAFFMRTPVWCRRRAAELGIFVEEIVATLLSDNALYHLRAAQGVVGLGDKHPKERLDAACRRALEVGDPSYRTVKGILSAGTEKEGTHEPSVPDAPAHLHGPESLFDHLNAEAFL